MDQCTKNNIDLMVYQMMLQLWRHAPIGHPYMSGEVGEYFSKSMQEKRELIDDAQHTAISKKIGWDE